jgi:hypothetical protein
MAFVTLQRDPPPTRIFVRARAVEEDDRAGTVELAGEDRRREARGVTLTIATSHEGGSSRSGPKLNDLAAETMSSNAPAYRGA